VTENRKGHPLTLPRFKTLALSTLMLGTVGAVTAPLLAQQSASEVRGIQLRFGTQIGLETQTNRALDPTNPGSSTAATVDLSFGLLTETRTQRFAFDMGATLRNLNGPTNDNSGFANPFISADYDRSSAAARLSLSASIRETDLSNDGLAFDSTAAEFVFVEGTATRRATNLSARLDWRDDAPLGFGVFAQLADNSFRGGAATGIGGDVLNDTRRLTLGASVRFDINDATRLDTELSWSRFEEETVANDRDTWRLTNDLTIDQPRGNTTFGFDITDTEEGTRFATRVGRSIEYPLGVVSGQVGLTRSASGNTFLSGALNLTRELPRGQFSMGLTRSVNSGTLEDNEQLNTTFTARYLHELSRVATLSFDANWAEAHVTSTGIDTINASIGATYSRELTMDWNMNFGVRHRFRDDDVTGTARSNEVFINLRRDFLTTF
jgi:hypothetical protein